jgi:hypothetical protein
MVCGSPNPSPWEKCILNFEEYVTDYIFLEISRELFRDQFQLCFVTMSFEYKVFEIDLSLSLFELPMCPLC